MTGTERSVLLRTRSDDGMIKRTLGRTGLEVTQLGYGSMGLRGPKTWGVRVVSERAADELLNSVLDAGINLIDTAPDYGISEQRIGQYIGSRRSECDRGPDRLGSCANRVGAPSAGSPPPLVGARFGGHERGGYRAVPPGEADRAASARGDRG